MDTHTYKNVNTYIFKYIHIHIYSCTHAFIFSFVREPLQIFLSSFRKKNPAGFFYAVKDKRREQNLGEALNVLKDANNQYIYI